MRYKPSYKLEIPDEDNFNFCISEIENQLSKYVHAGKFTSFDNVEIYYEYYLSEESKGNFVIVHGLSEFTKKFNELIYNILNQGYNVFIFDQRCHGLSGRLTKFVDLLHVNSFDDYVKDLEYFIDNIVLKTEDKPLYLYAHSMGGAVCSLYLAKFGNKINKTIMTAPMFEPVIDMVDPKVARIGVSLARVLFGPKRKFALSKEFNPDVTYNEEYGLSQERFNYNMKWRRENIMYQSTPMTYGWVYNSLIIGKRILKDKIINKINCPILIFSAEKDKTVENDIQYTFASRVSNCKIVEIKNTSHAILASDKETLTNVFDKIISFIKD